MHIRCIGNDNHFKLKICPCLDQLLTINPRPYFLLEDNKALVIT